MYIIDLDHKTIETLRSGIGEKNFEQNTKPYWEVVEKMVRQVVIEEEQEDFLAFLKPKALMEKMEAEREFSYRYQRVDELGENHIYEAHFVKIGKGTEAHSLVVGIRCIDKTIAREREHTQYSEALLNDCIFFYEFDVTDGYI